MIRHFVCMMDNGNEIAWTLDVDEENDKHQFTSHHEGFTPETHAWTRMRWSDLKQDVERWCLATPKTVYEDTYLQVQEGL